MGIKLVATILNPFHAPSRWFQSESFGTAKRCSSQFTSQKRQLNQQLALWVEQHVAMLAANIALPTRQPSTTTPSIRSLHWSSTINNLAHLDQQSRKSHPCENHMHTSLPCIFPIRIANKWERIHNSWDSNSNPHQVAILGYALVYGGFLKGGYPQSSFILDWDFPWSKNHPAIGIPPLMDTHSITH